MIDLFLVMMLGFLGSFGHCAGMCGPLTVAFSLSHKSNTPPTWQEQLYFHGLLNLGRLVSYALVGVGIGGLGSILIAGGQFAGLDSILRQGMAIFTGALLIWFGLAQIQPQWMPKLPILHPLTQGNLHQKLGTAMVKLSEAGHWWTPTLLGIIWGLIPCGFLYAAQIKAAETGNLWLGGATMLAFGVGTFPTMLGVGISTALVSANRRSQLFRMGGWVTLIIGIVTLLRNGDMVDYTGHAALLCLMLALIARPISRFWPNPLRYRRLLGVGAFVLSLAHVSYMFDHTFSWNLSALSFMLPIHQVGMWAGIIALALITPAALTSFDSLINALGKRWRQIHLLSVPALILCAIHTGLVGSHYLGELTSTMGQQLRTLFLGILTLSVLLARSPVIWSILSLAKFYAPPNQPK